jgi:hypothetical protein
MARRWPTKIVFTRMELEVEDPVCDLCGRKMHVCDHRHHRIFTLTGARHLVCKLVQCPNQQCPNSRRTFSPEAELRLTLPRWLIGWEVFCWIGHRRIARHWSVPQIRAELRDSYQITLSADALEDYLQRYQQMLAARQQDPVVLQQEYQRTRYVLLSIDGLQPEKGHETLYVVRELGRQRVWFAESLISSSAVEVQPLFARARQWAERLEKPVRLWRSDKQDACGTGIAAEFPQVPHRYCRTPFLRALAQPVLALDSHAKVRLRRRVRGLRAIERAVLEQRHPAPSTRPPSCPPHIGPFQAEGGEVVLDYCTVVRGILNAGQGGPLYPPGLRLAQALREVRQSLDRNRQAKKGAVRKRNFTSLPRASTKDGRRSNRCRNRLGAISRTCGRWTPRLILRPALPVNVGTASSNFASNSPPARIRSASISVR